MSEATNDNESTGEQNSDVDNGVDDDASEAETIDATEDRARELRDKARTTLDDIHESGPSAAATAGAANAAKSAAGSVSDNVSGSTKSAAAVAEARVNDSTTGAGVGRFLWWAIGLIAAIVLLALVATRCGDDDEPEAGDDVAAPSAEEADGSGIAGSEAETEGGEENGQAATAGDDDSNGDAGAETDADEATGSDTGQDGAEADPGDGTEDSAADGGDDNADLQALVDEALAGTGLVGLVGTVEGDAVTVTGAVPSEDDVATVESALAGLSLASIDNQVVVAEQSQAGTGGGGDSDDETGETPAASATDSDPDFTG